MPLVIHSSLRSKDLYNHWEKRDSDGEKEGRSGYGVGGGREGERWEDEEEMLKKTESK